MTFAAKLKTWRGARTQEAAAAALGVSLRTYQNWEQGYREPRGLARQGILMLLSLAKQPVDASPKSKPKTKHPRAERTRPARRTGRKSKHETKKKTKFIYKGKPSFASSPRPFARKLAARDEREMRYALRKS